MPENIQHKVAGSFAAYPLRVFDKQQIIVCAEEPLPGVFYIVEGGVGECDITPTGNEVVVNVFKPGAFFPVSTALNNIKRKFRAR